MSQPALAEAWPLLDEGLAAIGIEARDRLALREDLPALPWTSGVGVELHPSGRLDLGWRLCPAANPREQGLLAQAMATPAPLGPAWRALAHSEHGLGLICEALWGEWDRVGGLGPVSAFFALKEDLSRFPAGFVAGALRRALGPLGWSEAALDWLERRAAGPGQLRHVGVLPGRPEAPARITLAGVRPDDLGALELAIDPSVAALLTGPSPLLHLGHGAGPSSRVGVEWRGAPEGWGPHAARLGLRLPALDGWSAQGLLPDGTPWARRVAWIKWGLGSTGEIEAKAYLALWVAWR